MIFRDSYCRIFITCGLPEANYQLEESAELAGAIEAVHFFGGDTDVILHGIFYAVMSNIFCLSHQGIPNDNHNTIFRLVDMSLTTTISDSTLDGNT